MKTITSRSLPMHGSSVLEVSTAARFSTQLQSKPRRRRLAVHAAQLDPKTMRILQEKMQPKLEKVKRGLYMLEAEKSTLPLYCRLQLIQISARFSADEMRKQQSLLNEEAKAPGNEGLDEEVLRAFPDHRFPNLPDIIFETILDAARYNEHDKVIEFLEAGDDPNRVDDENRSPLHLAVLSRGILVIDILLEAGANIDAQDSNGDTPLHLAVRRGAVAIALQLLLAGADGAVRNKDGRTPAAVARQHPSSPATKNKTLLTLLDRVASA